jgi:UDP-glucose 4-epimerase
MLSLEKLNITMNKILIIGSSGFLGSNIFRKLTDIGFDAYGCDVIQGSTPSENFTLVDKVNLDYTKILEQRDFHFCINASGAASVPASLVNPQHDYILNTSNVFQILEAIRTSASDCKFITVSSAAVYGNPQTLPISEQSPINPLSPYGWHKYQAELICKEFYQNYNIKSCSIRIFSAYGVGLRKQLFWDIYNKTLNSNHITLFGTGNESRDFIYIDDIIQALICVMKNFEEAGEIINVANGEETTIYQAVETIRNICNNSFTYEFLGENRPGDPLNWKADISKIKKLGYKKTVKIEDGLERYIKWVKENG